jgi:hypothetical protein
MGGLLQDLGSLLRLEEVTLEAPLGFEATPLSGFGMFSHVLFGGNMVHSWIPCGSVAVAVCSSARDTCPLTSVSTVSPLRHTLPWLPAFFCHPYAVYIRPRGRANSHTVFCAPHRHREGGR